MRARFQLSRPQPELGDQAMSDAQDEMLKVIRSWQRPPVTPWKRWAKNIYIWLVLLGFVVWGIVSFYAIEIYAPWIVNTLLILGVFASFLWLMD